MLKPLDGNTVMLMTLKYSKTIQRFT